MPIKISKTAIRRPKTIKIEKKNIKKPHKKFRPKKHYPKIDYVVTCFFLRRSVKKEFSWVYPKPYRFITDFKTVKKIGKKSGLIINTPQEDTPNKKANLVIAAITKASPEDVKTYKRLPYYASFILKGDEKEAVDKFRDRMIKKQKEQSK